MLVMGVGMGWLAKVTAEAGRQQRVVAELRGFHARLELTEGSRWQPDWLDTHRCERATLYCSHDRDFDKPELLAHLRNLEALVLKDASISDLSSFTHLNKLERLFLDESSVVDLTPLANLTNLEELSLEGTAVHDIHPLARLTKLEMLNLNYTHVSDVTPLANLTKLQYLELDDAPVTDAMPLAELKHLKHLSFLGTSVTRTQVEQLQKALPNCLIFSDYDE